MPMADNGFPRTPYGLPAPNKTPPHVGITVTGYPVSEFNPTSSTANNETEPAPESARKISTALRIILVIAAIFLFSTEIFLLTLGNFLIPPLPYVSVMAGSAAIHNVTKNYVVEDLDVGFIVYNGAEKGIIFKNLTLMPYHGNEGEELLSDGVALPPFYQRGRNRGAVQFKVKALMVPVDEWEDYSASAMVGVSKVRFGLRARVRYRGRAWSRPEIPVKVDCYENRIRFGAAKGTPVVDTSDCYVQGLWDDRKRLLNDLALVVALALGLLAYLVMLLLVKLKSSRLVIRFRS